MLRAWFLLALFALVALSSAFSLDDIHIDGIEEYLHHGEKRQATGTGNSSPPPTSRTPTAGPSSEPPSSPTDGPSNSPTSNPPQSTPPPSPTGGSSGPASTPQSPRSTPTVHTSEFTSTSLSRYTTTITKTSNGQEVLETQTGTTGVPVTGKTTSTDPPNTQNGNGDGGSGLSQNNKNIIGGVVGGVGGALLLGGIALVFWRMKKRQHKVREDDDDLMAGTGAALGDKPHNTGSSPFQSNLEQYHNPGGRPNAAANF